MLNFESSRSGPSTRELGLLVADATRLVKASRATHVARTHDKVLRVARTIADIDGSDRIQVGHLNEAINYRLLDRKM